MLFRALLAALLVSCAVASAFNSAKQRAVANPTTPNQILDAVVERAATKIRALGWATSKNLQDGETDFNMNVDSAGTSSERFKIVNARMTGLGSLARSASGAFLNSNTILKGTLKLEDARGLADYEIVFAGTGNAPASHPKGSVIEKADNLFADIEIILDANLVPQSIKSYTVRSGKEGLEKNTAVGGDKMAAIDTAGMRASLLQLMKNTLATNVKVQINKAIQDWKAEASG